MKFETFCINNHSNLIQSFIWSCSNLLFYYHDAHRKAKCIFNSMKNEPLRSKSCELNNSLRHIKAPEDIEHSSLKRPGSRDSSGLSGSRTNQLGNNSSSHFFLYCGSTRSDSCLVSAKVIESESYKYISD